MAYARFFAYSSPESAPHVGAGFEAFIRDLVHGQAEPGAGHNQVDGERPRARADVQDFQAGAGLFHVEDVFRQPHFGQCELGQHALQQPVIVGREEVRFPSGGGDGAVVVGVQVVPGRVVDMVPPPGCEVITEVVFGPRGDEGAARPRNLPACL
jgi:hypothetical protein